MEHLDRYHAKLYAAKLIASLDDNLMNFKSINFMPLSSSKTKRSNMDSKLNDCQDIIPVDREGQLLMNISYSNCCRRMIYLDFSNTQFSGWKNSHYSNVVKGYYCFGRCPYYGEQIFDSEPKKHIFYDEFMNAHSKKLGLSPCCAPLKFDPLMVTVKYGKFVH
ncbi:unnamed protein product [Dracunculus medinensis]|uniref:TGF_BETA_2 domain-containing protein n=1 Tax=Dracunculus medinensis TaxID=318479 RepID=A0A0N4UIF3_DRAME|nr:unnamed protein product [Dracunculus medinensis]